MSHRIRFFIEIFTIPLFIVSIVSPALGEVHKNTLEVGIFSGAHVYLSHRNVIKRNDFALGGRLGWNFPYGIGSEFTISYVPAISDPIHLLTLDLNAVYHLYNEGMFIPYAAVGPGIALYFPKGKNNNASFEINCAVGFKMLYWRIWGFRFDVRYAYRINGPVGTSIRFHTLILAIGLDFLLFTPDRTTLRKSSEILKNQ